MSSETVIFKASSFYRVNIENLLLKDSVFYYNLFSFFEVKEVNLTDIRLENANASNGSKIFAIIQSEYILLQNIFVSNMHLYENSGFLLLTEISSLTVENFLCKSNTMTSAYILLINITSNNYYQKSPQIILKSFYTIKTISTEIPFIHINSKLFNLQLTLCDFYFEFSKAVRSSIFRIETEANCNAFLSNIFILSSEFNTVC